MVVVALQARIVQIGSWRVYRHGKINGITMFDSSDVTSSQLEMSMASVGAAQAFAKARLTVWCLSMKSLTTQTSIV